MKTLHSIWHSEKDDCVSVKSVLFTWASIFYVKPWYLISVGGLWLRLCYCFELGMFCWYCWSYKFNLDCTKSMSSKRFFVLSMLVCKINFVAGVLNFPILFSVAALFVYILCCLIFFYYYCLISLAIQESNCSSKSWTNNVTVFEKQEGGNHFSCKWCYNK